MTRSYTCLVKHRFETACHLFNSLTELQLQKDVRAVAAVAMGGEITFNSETSAKGFFRGGPC